MKSYLGTLLFICLSGLYATSWAQRGIPVFPGGSNSRNRNRDPYRPAQPQTQPTNRPLQPVNRFPRPVNRFPRPVNRAPRPVNRGPQHVNLGPQPVNRFPVNRQPQVQISQPRYRIVTVDVEPYLFTNRTGYMAELLQDLSRRTGFQYDLTVYSRSRSGVGNFLIEKVANGEFDIAAGPLTSTRWRDQVVDFSRPFSRSRPHLLINADDEDSITFASTLSQTGVPIGTLADTSLVEYFISTERQVMQQIWTQIQAGEDLLIGTIEEAYQKVKMGNFSFFIDGPIAEYLREKDPCQLKVKAASQDHFPYAFAVRKGMPAIIRRLNDGIFRAGRDGVLLRLKNKYWKEDTECEIEEYDDYY